MFTKFIATILCALCLVSCAAGAGCIVYNQDLGLYDDTMEDWIDNYVTVLLYDVARNSALLYAAEHLGNCTDVVLSNIANPYYGPFYIEFSWTDCIYEGDTLLKGNTPPEGSTPYTFTVVPEYPTPWREGDGTDYLYRKNLWLTSEYSGKEYKIDLAYYTGPTYTVTIYLHPSALDCFYINFMSLMYTMRYYSIAIVVISLLAFAVSLVYLCFITGRHPDTDEVYPVALNRIPLDLYLAGITLPEILMGRNIIYVYEEMIHYNNQSWGSVAGILLVFMAMALMIVGFFCALSAQMKTKGGLWWRKTILFFLLYKVWQCLAWIGGYIRAAFGFLPLVWQWLAIAMLMIAAPPALFLASRAAFDYFWYILWLVLFAVSIVADILLLGWWIWYMGQILKGAAIMGGGNLDHQIPTRFMLGKFRGFAESLNSMAEASRLAAERQLKSERMKTELITNVSHDIKTPLTSIINYVDLMKKPHSEDEGQQYLEVLDRQSQRLKKLIVDLMDMSKASTGNVPVELAPMDAVEAVNQALGEYSDKLAMAGLLPLFHCPSETLMIRADGRLLWRVLSNLLGNTVKYAMPGTRIYVDLMTDQNNAVLSIKNISRDQLNVAADELLERFVRGDASRNTEGSGLGLNIAKSLMELQGGQMHLTVDGDLFKVTIALPLCGE